jgi:hypothetical protein
MGSDDVFRLAGLLPAEESNASNSKLSYKWAVAAIKEIGMLSGVRVERSELL